MAAQAAPPLRTRDLRRTGLLFALGSATLYGIWPAAFREVYAAGGNVAFVAVTTIWLRAIFIAGACVLTGRKLFPTRASTRQSLKSGAFQALSLMTINAAVEYLPGPVAIIILYSHTLMLLFFMAWRGEAVLDLATVLTTATALVGLSFVIDVWHVQSVASLIGIGLAVLSALFTLANLYTLGQQSHSRDPLIVTAESFLVASVLVLAICVVQRPVLPGTLSGYRWMALAGMTLVAGTFLRAYGIAFLGAFRWSLYLKLEPIFTALFSATLVHEYLKPSQYAGMVIVLGSLATFQVAEHRARLKARVV